MTRLFSPAIVLRNRLSKRKRMEERLRKSEEKFRTIFALTPDAVLISDEQGIITMANQQAESLLGYSLNELIGLSIEALLPEPFRDGHPALRAAFAASATSRPMSVGRIVKALGKNNTDLDVQINLAMINVDQSRFFISSLEDISPRKLAEQQLQDSEKQLKFVLKGGYLGFWDWNILTNEVQCNEIWAEMLGYTTEEVQQSPHQLTDFIYPDDRDKAWLSICSVLEGRSETHKIEYRMLHKDGSIRWILDQARVVQYDAQGKACRMTGTHTDITQQKIIETELSIAAIAFQSQEAIVITDTENVILRVNKAFTESTGYTEAEALGKKISILKSGRHDAAFYKTMWKSILRTGTWQGEIWDKHKNGNISLKWLAITAVTGKDGKVTHYVGTHTDITERKKTEDALRASVAKFRSIIENSPIPRLLCDQQYNITFLNNAFVQNLGYTQDEIPALVDLWSKIYPFSSVHQTEFINLQTKLTQDKDEQTAIEPREMSILCKDGIIRTYMVSITTLDFDESFVANYLFIFFDITERKQAQESLRILGERFQLSQSYGGIGIWENDLVNNRHYCSEVVKTLFELADGQYNRESLLKIMHPEDVNRENKAYIEHIEKRKPYDLDYRIISSLGAESWVHAVSQVEYNVDGKPVLVRGIIQDITDRKQVEITLLDFSNHMETVREDERTRIAREIHDELGGTLTALKINLSWLLNQLPSELKSCHENIAMMNQHLNGAIVSFRRIIADLRPNILDHLGLLAAIDWKISEFSQQTGIQFVLTLPEHDIAIEEKRNIAVFRIMQETLNNIYVHAKATQVFFDVEMDEKDLVMRITDNGCGMTDEQMHEVGKYGLLGMQERARHFGGKVLVVSQPGKGTAVTLEMPIKDTPKRRFYD